MSLSLLTFDYALFRFFNAFAGRSAVGDSVIVMCAEYVIFLMIAGLALLFIFNKKSPQLQLHTIIEVLAAGFFGRVIVASLIRAFFFRPRPFVIANVIQLIPQSPLEASFPSGHATIMFALAFSLFYTKNKRFAALYLGLAVISSLCRVIGGIHYPLDIVGGAAVGAFSAIIMHGLFHDVFPRISKNKKEALQPQ